MTAVVKKMDAAVVEAAAGLVLNLKRLRLLSADLLRASNGEVTYARITFEGRAMSYGGVSRDGYFGRFYFVGDDDRVSESSRRLAKGFLGVILEEIADIEKTLDEMGVSVEDVA